MQCVSRWSLFLLVARLCRERHDFGNGEINMFSDNQNRKCGVGQRRWLWISCLLLWLLPGTAGLKADDYHVTDGETGVKIETPQLEAVIKKKGYVSGVCRQTFLDKKTGFRDPGFGLDIVDWLMEPGSDEAYRGKLDKGLPYHFNDMVHGNRPKRSIEGPQICTRARELKPEVIRGKDFVAVQQSFQYHIAAPGKQAGSTWTQFLVFPVGKRYFVSMDRIDTVNSSEGLFLRIDMPGHIRHTEGDTFSEIYLSYLGGGKGLHIPSSEFSENFAPDTRFHYLREKNPEPRRFIRACRLRDTDTGKAGPWLAGMTLDPNVVYEAWCHQRGYVCMIQEFGGRPIKAGESFSAAFIVGYFDSIDEMQQVYDLYKGATGLTVTEEGWRLTGRE